MLISTLMSLFFLENLIFLSPCSQTTKFLMSLFFLENLIFLSPCSQTTKRFGFYQTGANHKNILVIQIALSLYILTLKMFQWVVFLWPFFYCLLALFLTLGLLLVRICAEVHLWRKKRTRSLKVWALWSTMYRRRCSMSVLRRTKGSALKMDPVLMDFSMLLPAIVWSYNWCYALLNLVIFRK